MRSSGIAVSQPTPSTPVSVNIGAWFVLPRRAESRSPAPRDGAASTRWTIRLRRGRSPSVRTERPGRLPAQLSKICTTSAPGQRSGRTDSRSRPRSADRSAVRSRAGSAIGPQPRIAPGRGCRAADHVGRDRPGCAAEADQRQRPGESAWRTLGEPSRKPAELLRCRSRFERAKFGRADESGSSRGPSPSMNSTVWPSACGTTRMSGEQDRRVEAEAPDRLQRHLGRQRRACSTDRGSRRPSPAPRGTPAGSAPPAASARSAAAQTASPAKGAQEPAVSAGEGRTCHRARLHFNEDLES